MIEQDPRVRKHAQTLFDKGWQVTTIGLKPPADTGVTLPWSAIHIDHPLRLAPAKSRGRKFAQHLRDGTLVRRAQYYYTLRIGLKNRNTPYLEAFWQNMPQLKAFLEAANSLPSCPDIWLANDWEMLPIAQSMKAVKGGKIIYDSHEFATDQFSHNPGWVKWKRPLVAAVEADLIPQADAVSSVSPGVCEKIQRYYKLADKPICIRNIPRFVESPFRSTGSKITCLYHGVVGPGRSLEEIIRSTALWQKRFHLIIRGPEGQAGYKQKLEALAAAQKGAVPITIEPPVPMDDLIYKARQADIGIMALATQSAHNQYALPNKLFEYMMAGLGLCVTRNEDMSVLVQNHKNGTIINSLSSEDIAESINALTPEIVDQYKRTSLAAAQHLNWENEQQRLISLVDRVVDHLTGA